MNQTQSISSIPKSKRLTRDQRLQIKTLHESGMIQTKIAAQLGITLRQVGYTLSIPYLEPKKAPGRAPTLSSKDVDQIEAFITSTTEGRRMSWLELACGPFHHFGVSEKVIHKEMKKRGYARYLVRKTPLSEEIKENH